MHRTVSILFITLRVGKEARSLISNHFFVKAAHLTQKKARLMSFFWPGSAPLPQQCFSILSHIGVTWAIVNITDFWVPPPGILISLLGVFAWTCWGSDAAQVLLTYSQGLESLPYSGACFLGFLVASWCHDWQLCHQRSSLSSDMEKKSRAPLATWAPSPELLRAGNIWDIIGSEAPPRGSRWSGRIEESELACPREELRQSFLSDMTTKAG